MDAEAEAEVAAEPQFFPEYFSQGWHSHLFLIEVDNTTYGLYPPNQCDWFYNLKRINDYEWDVSGHKDDTINGIGTELCHYKYYLINNKWCVNEMPLLDNSQQEVSMTTLVK